MKLSIIPFLLVATATAKIRGSEKNEERNLLPDEGRRRLPPMMSMYPPCDPCDPPVVGYLACAHDNIGDNSCYERPTQPYPTEDGCYAGTTTCRNVNAVGCVAEWGDCTSGVPCCGPYVCQYESQWWSHCVSPPII